MPHFEILSVFPDILDLLDTKDILELDFFIQSLYFKRQISNWKKKK
jgi:hypothetical protein